MSPNEGLELDKIFIFSSDSSDSESLLHEDLKTNESEINQEWEAIERTLYQEPGQQVTDPSLLKECKLWRDTFPHFRVRGTKIDLEKTKEDQDKNIQTLENHFNLKKLEEKRESIKNKVVGELVERIIAKFSTGKESFGSHEAKRNLKNGVQITEIYDNPGEKLSEVLNKSNNKESCRNNEIKSVIRNPKKESYFERGKLTETKETNGVTKEEMEESLSQIFDGWEQEMRPSFKHKTTEELKKPPRKSPQKEVIGLKCLEKPTRIKRTPPSESLSSLVKPFEMKTKIDKKYEGMLDKIMERRFRETTPTRHCRKVNSGIESRTYQESLEKLRIASGFEGYLGKNKNLPKINKFNNKWLERGDINAEERKIRPKISEEASPPSPGEFDDRFIEQLKKEMALSYKRPARRSGVIENVSLRRPKPLKINERPDRTFKSSSCGNLPKRSKKRAQEESNPKNRTKSTNLSNRGSKPNPGRGVLLPPIDTGIICTELTGRPKIGPVNPSKKH